MGLYLGNQGIVKAYLGNTEILKAYHGSIECYSSAPDIYGEELIVNGVMVDADSDGLADGWYLKYGYGTPTIITDNGFTGNVQKIEVTNTNYYYYLGLAQSFTFVKDKKYRLTFNLKSNIYVMPFVGTSQNIEAIPSTGGAVVAKDITFTCGIDYDNTSFMFFAGMAAAVGDYFEVNNVSLKEILVPYGAELIYNGIAFTDSNSDGLADGWDLHYGYGTTSIVTGNGFTGNAQRVEATVEPFYYLGFEQYISLVKGKTYRLQCNIRTNIYSLLYVGISQILDAFDSTGGVVVAKDITFTVTTDDCNAFMVFGGHASAVGQYFEINNISIKEVF